MNRENPLNANAVRNSTNGKCLGNSAALNGNYGTLESLESFSLAFTDLNPDFDSVTYLDCLRNVSLEAVLSD